MPIPLGVLAVAGAGGGVAGAYELLETVSVGTAVSSVSFSNLNSTYGSTNQHLQIRGTVRGTNTSTPSRLAIRMNSDEGTNYSYHSLFARGSTVNSTSGTDATYGWLINDTPSGIHTANSYAGFVTDVLDPFETTKNTTLRSLGGFAPSSGSDVLQSVGLVSMVWRNTAAVTTLTIITVSGTAHAVGSRFSLYGMRSS
jgi:hypothetical protein